MPDQGTYALSFPQTRRGQRPLVRLVLVPVFLGVALLLAGFAAALNGREGDSSAIAQPARADNSSDKSLPGEQALVSETSSIIVAPVAAETAASAPVAEPRQAAQTLPPPAITSPEVLLPLPPPPAPAANLPGGRWLAEGFVFVIEGQEWDADSFTNVDAALSKLPARIRSLLANRELGPVNILVNRSGRSISGKQPYGGPANYFSTNDGRNELVLFPGQSVPTILHELGHAYNLRRVGAGRYAVVLLDPEMQSFMAATGWRVLSTPDQVRAARDHMQVQMAYDGQQIWPRLSNNDPLEDFANSFALYFFSPDDLRARSQARFDWFEANVGR